jgi:hypothetical protein
MGEIIATVKPEGNIPLLVAAENRTRFSSDGREEPPVRVRRTIISNGKPLRLNPEKMSNVYIWLSNKSSIMLGDELDAKAHIIISAWYQPACVYIVSSYDLQLYS